MPELPEVETTCRGIAPFLKGRRITTIQIRQARLRWPVPNGLADKLAGAEIQDVQRRAKYILLQTSAGTAILHLGMSGSLRVIDSGTPYQKHDHVDILLDSGKILRFRDPRRFGALLWGGRQAAQHPLLSKLGVEPLAPAFCGEYLHAHSRKRKISVKQLLMDGAIVVGIGNIYANEALFAAGIRPGRAAGRLSRDDCDHLVRACKTILQRAITAGGTTLRDFTQSDGKPGYFRQELLVYGRENEPCLTCGTPIKAKRIAQRTSYYCPQCQHR